MSSADILRMMLHERKTARPAPLQIKHKKGPRVGVYIGRLKKRIDDLAVAAECSERLNRELTLERDDLGSQLYAEKHKPIFSHDDYPRVMRGLEDLRHENDELHCENENLRAELEYCQSGGGLTPENDRLVAIYKQRLDDQCAEVRRLRNIIGGVLDDGDGDSDSDGNSDGGDDSDSDSDDAECNVARFGNSIVAKEGAALIEANLVAMINQKNSDAPINSSWTPTTCNDTQNDSDSDDAECNVHRFGNSTVPKEGAVFTEADLVARINQKNSDAPIHSSWTPTICDDTQDDSGSDSDDAECNVHRFGKSILAKEGAVLADADLAVMIYKQDPGEYAKSDKLPVVAPNNVIKADSEPSEADPTEVISVAELVEADPTEVIPVVEGACSIM